MLELKEKALQRFERKNILIWGFGLEGKSTLAFLKKNIPTVKISVLDEKEIEQDDQDITMLTQANFNEFDFIFKSPGIVLHQEEFPMEKLTSQTDLFLEVFRSQIIGVTGTKGKSTTCSLMNHVLKTAGQSSVLVGNIGIPCLDAWDAINEETKVVFEMSCHQLEFVKQSPHIAVFLNCYEEHLDHYGTFEKYCDAKSHIYTYQTPEDVLYVNDQIKVGLLSQKVLRCGVEIEGGIYSTVDGFFANGSKVILPQEAKLIGKHNHYNAAIVYAIAKSKGVSDEEFVQAYSSFQPLQHRLEVVAKVQGATYISDSISTVPESTIEAIKSLKDIDCILIGGMDRGINYDSLIAYLEKCDIPVILLLQAAGKRIASGWPKDTKKEVYVLETLEEAVKTAKSKTRPGKICLLSPAAPSYGYFKNFVDRGDTFTRLVLNNDELS